MKIFGQGPPTYFSLPATVPPVVDPTVARVAVSGGAQYYTEAAPGMELCSMWKASSVAIAKKCSRSSPQIIATPIMTSAADIASKMNISAACAAGFFPQSCNELVPFIQSSPPEIYIYIASSVAFMWVIAKTLRHRQLKKLERHSPSDAAELLGALIKQKSWPLVKESIKRILPYGKLDAHRKLYQEEISKHDYADIPDDVLSLAASLDYSADLSVEMLMALARRGAWKGIEQAFLRRDPVMNNQHVIGNLSLPGSDNVEIRRYVLRAAVQAGIDKKSLAIYRDALSGLIRLNDGDAAYAHEVQEFVKLGRKRLRLEADSFASLYYGIENHFARLGLELSEKILRPLSTEDVLKAYWKKVKRERDYFRAPTEEEERFDKCIAQELKCKESWSDISLFDSVEDKEEAIIRRSYEILSDSRKREEHLEYLLSAGLIERDGG